MKQKFKLKLNVFDIVIIVLVFAAGFVGYRLLGAGTGSGAAILSPGKSVTVHYTLELSNLPIGVGAMIQPGDSVIEVVEKHAIGTVVACTVEPYRSTSLNRNTGDMVLVDMPGRETAIITMELRVTDTGRELDANGFALRGGVLVSVTGPGWAGQGLILGIERETGEGN